MVRRGDIVLVDLAGATGAEIQNGPKGSRPCIVIQNDEGNANSPLTIIATLTHSGVSNAEYPHVARVSADELGPGGKDSAVDCGQLRAVDQKSRLKHVLGHLPATAMDRIDAALRNSLGL